MKRFYGIILLIVLLTCIIAVCSSCKLFREIEKRSSDSTAVKKEVEAVQKVDTSKSKSEHTYTKETFYYPGRDTTINNFYTTVPPAVYIRESGTKKEENNNAVFENWQRNFMDSIRTANASKQADTKVKVLDFWQILALGVLGLIVLYFLGTKLTLKK